MKIHSDILTRVHIISAIDKLREERVIPVQVFISDLTEHDSRSRARRFDLGLYAAYKVEGDKRGKKNTGGYGAGEDYAATWIEWGQLIAALYKFDPDALIGEYGHATSFHERTHLMFSDTDWSNMAYDPYPYVRKGDRFARRVGVLPHGNDYSRYRYEPRNVPREGDAEAEARAIHAGIIAGTHTTADWEA